LEDFEKVFCEKDNCSCNLEKQHVGSIEYFRVTRDLIRKKVEDLIEKVKLEDRK